MVMLNQLPRDNLARIVEINCGYEMKQKLTVKGVTEGCFIKVISNTGCIVARINSKIFNISKELAHKITVINIEGE